MGKLVCIFSQEIYFTDYFIEIFMNYYNCILEVQIRRH